MTEIFRTVLNMSITGGIIALAVLLLRIPLKRAPRWITCALWMVVFLRLAVPVSFSSQLSLLSGIGAPAPENGAVTYFSTDTASPANHAKSSIANDSQTLPATESFSQSANSLAPTPQASADPMQIWLAIGTIIWLIGMVGLLLYAAIQYLRLHKQVRDAVRTELDVFETDAVTAPFVMGILKPRIILPIGMKSNERESVLLHERAHIYRLDHVVKPVAFLILTLHWFNPIVWLAFRLFCDDLEASCDERAIRALDREKIAIYGEALLRLGTRKMAFSGGPLAFGEHCTKERIVNVLSYKKPAFWIVAAALLTAVAAAIILLANPTVPPKKAIEPTVKEPISEQKKASDFDFQELVVPDSKSGGITEISGNIGDFLFYRCDISVLGDKSVSADTLAKFVNQLANGQSYIQAYLKINAKGCYDTSASVKKVNYIISNDDKYSYDRSVNPCEIRIGKMYWHCSQYYVFMILHPESLHWQHYGYAQYVGRALNPYDMWLSKINEKGTSPDFGVYAQTYLDHGGNPTNLTKDDYRILVDSVAYYCIKNGMNWGNAYESYPITKIYGFTEPAEQGDDMSVAMASSFCAYLAEKYGFDKLTSYCAGQMYFREAFGISFDRAFDHWEETITKEFS